MLSPPVPPDPTGNEVEILDVTKIYDKRYAVTFKRRSALTTDCGY